MNIYIGIDNEEIGKFKDIAELMTDRVNQKKLGKLKSMKEYQKGSVGICILFSNRLKYIEETAKRIEGKIINVTDNLSSSHIMMVLEHAIDLYYSKSDVDTLVNRLEKTIQELNKETVR